MPRHHHRGRGLLALLALGGAAALALKASTNRAGKGHPPDSAPGYASRQRRFGDYVVSGNTVTIDRPRHELFAFWRDFSNLPQFMENVVSVQPSGQDRAIWTIKAPAGQTVELETEIVQERPDELIAWRSVEGSQVDAEGKVKFRDAPGERGTVLEAIVAYSPPAGDVGRWIAKIFGREPNVQGRRELKRFKMLMETGEIADSRYHTSQGD